MTKYHNLVRLKSEIRHKYRFKICYVATATKFALGCFWIGYDVGFILFYFFWGGGGGGGGGG